MIEYENECVGCSTILHSCLGSACPNKNVPHYYCDECGEEDDLYDFDNRQLCIECIKNLHDKVSE